MIQILQVFYEEADFLKLILGPNGDPYFYEKIFCEILQSLSR